ncbi:MAG: hypothetical protein KQH63_06950 [Desulfobulbaceae bacterium]|nr:hypothetical protein [Desulfobulbaceae bacterium]
MKKLYSILCAATLVCGMGFPNSANAGKPPQVCDYGDEATCVADSNCEWVIQGKKGTCQEVSSPTCTEGETQSTTCGQGECAGNSGIETCDANGNWINDTCDPFAGATAEVCDGLDNNCDGSVDEGGVCDGGPHDNITGTFTTPADVTAKCLECHNLEGAEIINSLHGMMATPAPDVVNATRDSQKLSEINTFCTYPNPNQAGAACLGCHPTLGKYENLTAADIDCLRCHNDAYKRAFAAEPDPANYYNVVDWQGTPRTYIPSDQDDSTGDFYVEFNWGAMPGLTASDLIAGVHRPTTTTCLSCHAKAGGGDWTKRGDFGLSTANPSSAEDVHLASVANGGAGLTCADCHISTAHKIPGRGIDLRPSEGGDAKDCVDCHAIMAAGGHATQGNRAEPDRHVARVSCKSCHIPAFGKGGATELWRDWTTPHWNQALCNGQGAWAGEEHKVADVVPDHVFFDGTSYVYELGQTLTKVDPISGLDLVADANGDVNDALGVSLLVPIKRHQSNMAVMNSGADAGKVIPFDVVWQFMTGKFDEAAENGKAYAGYTGTYEWINLEAEMALNHGVSPAASVADCTTCHHARNEFEIEIETKLDKLGYALKDADKNGVVDAVDKAIVCSQCHAEKSLKRDWEQMHAHSGKGSGIGCTFCHDIDRPERGLCEPCNPDGTQNDACINEFVDTNYYDHCNP